MNKTTIIFELSSRLYTYLVDEDAMLEVINAACYALRQTIYIVEPTLDELCEARDMFEEKHYTLFTADDCYYQGILGVLKYSIGVMEGTL